MAEERAEAEAAVSSVERRTIGPGNAQMVMVEASMAVVVVEASMEPAQARPMVPSTRRTV